MPLSPRPQAQISSIERMLAKHKADTSLAVENASQMVRDLETRFSKQLEGERQKTRVQSAKIEELERQLKAANEEAIRCRMETRQAKETATSLFDKNETLAQQIEDMEDAVNDSAARCASAEAKLKPNSNNQAEAYKGLCQRLQRHVISRLERLSYIQRRVNAGAFDPHAAQDAENVAYVMVHGWWAVENEWNEVTGRGLFGEAAPEEISKSSSGAKRRRAGEGSQ